MGGCLRKGDSDDLRERTCENFDDVCAVNNITLNIPEGEMLGLLGTNGAGKTTLLRMIAGVLEADGGSIVVDGANITSGDVSEEIFICRMILIFSERLYGRNDFVL